MSVYLALFVLRDPRTMYMLGVTAIVDLVQACGARYLVCKACSDRVAILMLEQGC